MELKDEYVLTITDKDVDDSITWVRDVYQKGEEWEKSGERCIMAFVLRNQTGCSDIDMGWSIATLEEVTYNADEKARRIVFAYDNNLTRDHRGIEILEEVLRGFVGEVVTFTRKRERNEEVGHTTEGDSEEGGGGIGES